MRVSPSGLMSGTLDWPRVTLAPLIARVSRAACATDERTVDAPRARLVHRSGRVFLWLALAPLPCPPTASGATQTKSAVVVLTQAQQAGGQADQLQQEARQIAATASC